MLNSPAAGRPRVTESNREHKVFSREYLIPFILVTVLFFLWGIPNNLNDILIRQFMKSFAITRFKAGLVQSAFYLGYFSLSMPAAMLMRRFGYKAGLVTGLLLYAAGSLLFWPSAIIQSYQFFLFSLFVIASGLAFLETGANSFIAQLGDPATSERRLNFSQAFNPLGSIAGVLIGTTFIFSGVELSPSQVLTLRAAGRYQAYLQQETMRVISPYLILGCVVAFWAILISRTPFPALAGENAPARTEVASGDLRALLRNRFFVQAVFAQFLYVGAQVGTWSYFITYFQDYVNGSEKLAGYFLTGTLVAFGAGRFAATYLMRFVRPSILMGVYSLVNVILVAIGVIWPGWIGLWAIFLTSFFMSLMYPTIFALGVKGLGPHTKLGGSLIVMAIVGGAVFTPVMGLVFQATASMAKAMLVPLVCYLFIAYFSFAVAREKAGSNV